MDGNINIDFEGQEKYHDIGIICECKVMFSTPKSSHIVIKEELEREDQAKAIDSLSLFTIGNFTYVEVRDCQIEAKGDYSDTSVAFEMNKEEELCPYKGILSVKSCNISGFANAFHVGPMSILSIEKSSIINCKQSALFCFNPKILKLSGTTIDNINGNGVDLQLGKILQGDYT